MESPFLTYPWRVEINVAEVIGGPGATGGGAWTFFAYSMQAGGRVGQNQAAR